MIMAAITAVAAGMTVVTKKDVVSAMADETAADAAVEMTIRMTMIVGAGATSVQNHDLNKDLLCLTRIQAVDVKNNRIIIATDNRNYNLSYLKNVRGLPAHFFEKFVFTGNQLRFSGIL